MLSPSRFAGGWMFQRGDIHAHDRRNCAIFTGPNSSISFSMIQQ
uniref:Uncharacterized protein n=1 Tax=Arundo donax TaxID=35708 RepID=A0A0A9I051_ARUDO